jgi:tRNA A-37 threonylcarbamoyl transferase component Bud32
VCHAAFRSDFACCPLDGGPLSVTPHDPLIGNVLARRYAIEALIGQGAMGRIYRARHAGLVDKRYAVKILLGDYAASAEMRLRFANEAKNTSRLDHPNIVRVVDFGRTSTGLLFLVMELVEGASLGALVRAGLVDRSRGLAIVRQLCAGLAHAHAHGVIHRDFKPDNILIVGDTARIVDFGLAISTDDDDPRLTSSGVLCTPAYAAPEQLTGGVLDHRVDLYALGITMFELFTGRLPFSSDADAMVASKLARTLPAIPPSIPDPLGQIILRLLAPDPNRRFRSADEVIAALDRIREMPARHQRSAMAAMALVGVAALPWQLAKSATAPVPADRPAIASAAPHVDEPRRIAEPPRITAIAPSAVAHVDKPRPAAIHRPAVAKVGASLVALDVVGPLSPSVIRRALDRVDLHACPGRGAVSASFTIGETRRASELVVTPRDRCIAGLLASVRTEVAPDVGDTHVALRIAF